MNIKLNEVEETSRRPQDQEFPFLARWTDSGAVWLFVAPEKAVAVYIPNWCTDIGDFEEIMWTLNDNRWEVLPAGSTVTFTQE